MTFPEGYPEFTDSDLAADARAVLIRVIRTAFPHPSFPDAPYERTADTIISEAQKATWSRIAITQGLLSLSRLADGDFRELDDEAAIRVLRRIEKTEFFDYIRRATILYLYDNPDIWDVLDYEGPSFDKGGYLNRGFDDLDWLPRARVETYEGPEPLVEITENIPLAEIDLPPTTTSHIGHGEASTINPGSIATREQG